MPDTTDACPTGTETRNGFRDADGCPDELGSFTGVINSGINFATARAKILPTSKPVLDRAIAVLREYPDISIVIEGHTDDRGKREMNMALSRRRADAVKWYLVDTGIPDDRITTLGVGPDQPRAPGTSAAARAQNRRIEFQITSDGTKIEIVPAPAPK